MNERGDIRVVDRADPFVQLPCAALDALGATPMTTVKAVGAYSLLAVKANEQRTREERLRVTVLHSDLKALWGTGNTETRELLKALAKVEVISSYLSERDAAGGQHRIIDLTRPEGAWVAAPVWRFDVVREPTRSRLKLAGLLTILMQLANDQREDFEDESCKVSRAELMALTGMSDASLRRATQTLERQGLLQRSSSWMANGAQGPSIWELPARQQPPLHLETDPPATSEHPSPSLEAPSPLVSEQPSPLPKLRPTRERDPGEEEKEETKKGERTSRVTKLPPRDAPQRLCEQLRQVLDEIHYAGYATIDDAWLSAARELLADPRTGEPRYSEERLADFISQIPSDPFVRGRIGSMPDLLKERKLIARLSSADRDSSGLPYELLVKLAARFGSRGRAQAAECARQMKEARLALLIESSGHEWQQLCKGHMNQKPSTQLQETWREINEQVRGVA